jgi:predicted CDP-diglyceride synthetase/phosphatidate cytidylyltransferase
MHDGGPEQYPILTYGWVIILSIWGGVIGFWRKCREGHTRCFNIVEFIGEIATSMLVGLITFWMAESAHIAQVTTAALVAISGHMGSRLLFHAERIIEVRVKRMGESSGGQP